MELQFLKLPMSIDSRLAGKVISDSALQPEKAFSPIPRRVSGNETRVRRVHSENVAIGMYVTPSGMENSIRLEHPEKIPIPISVIFFGRVICVRLVQEWKA